MRNQDHHLPDLKAMIDRLGDHWSHDFPLRPQSYEGMEHLVIHTYAMAGHDWAEFKELLIEARKELDLMITLAERINGTK